jgi:hypothetical protein
VLRVKSQAVKALLQYFTLERNPDELMKALKSIPAHDLRFTKNNQQVDAFFPHASKHFGSITFHFSCKMRCATFPSLQCFDWDSADGFSIPGAFFGLL